MDLLNSYCLINLLLIFGCIQVIHGQFKKTNNRPARGDIMLVPSLKGNQYLSYNVPRNNAGRNYYNKALAKEVIKSIKSQKLVKELKECKNENTQILEKATDLLKTKLENKESTKYKTKNTKQCIKELRKFVRGLKKCNKTYKNLNVLHNKAKTCLKTCEKNIETCSKNYKTCRCKLETCSKERKIYESSLLEDDSELIQCEGNLLQCVEALLNCSRDSPCESKNWCNQTLFHCNHDLKECQVGLEACEANRTKINSTQEYQDMVNYCQNRVGSTSLVKLSYGSQEGVFYISPESETASWENATRQCCAKGMKQVNIINEDMKTALNNHLISRGVISTTILWTSFADLENEGRFTAQDGSHQPINDVFSVSGTAGGPDNSCVSFQPVSGGSFQVQNCTKVLRFICQLQEPCATFITV